MENKKDIDKYVDELVDLFQQSSPDKYIILGMKIDNGICNIKCSTYNSSGKESIADTVSFECNSYFYESLKKIVLQFRINCNVVKEDIVNLDGDEYVAFRMITKNNDMFTIDGLTIDFANSLLERLIN